MPQCEEMGNDCKIGNVEVLRSNAGYYIGYYCKECGPWDRLSKGYFATEEEAKRQLNDFKKSRNHYVAEYIEEELTRVGEVLGIGDILFLAQKEGRIDLRCWVEEAHSAFDMGAR